MQTFGKLSFNGHRTRDPRKFQATSLTWRILAPFNRNRIGSQPTRAPEQSGGSLRMISWQSGDSLSVQKKARLIAQPGL